MQKILIETIFNSFISFIYLFIHLIYLFNLINLLNYICREVHVMGGNYAIWVSFH